MINTEDDETLILKADLSLLENGVGEFALIVRKLTLQAVLQPLSFISLSALSRAYRPLALYLTSPLTPSSAAPLASDIQNANPLG